MHKEGGESMGDNEELIRRMNEIKWFHSIPLRDGIVTPRQDNSMNKLGQVCLPEDLTGKTVLDIGAWDGFNQGRMSFHAYR